MLHQKNCVYTCLIGDYEELAEQDIARESGVEFICFTDNPTLKSDTWKIRLITPILPFDPIRSQRWVKINAHNMLPEYERSIYIDTTVILNEIPEEIFSKYVDCDFFIMKHSYRDAVIDEFLQVSHLGFDDQSTIFEQMNHYLASSPEVLEETPYWCGLMIRNHHNDQVKQLCNIWSTHVMRYSRRDQLSLNAACTIAGYKPAEIPGDNFKSEFHTWGSSGRNRNKSIRDPRRFLMPVQGQVRDLQNNLDQKEKMIELLEKRAARPSLSSHFMPQNVGDQLDISMENETQLRGPKRRLIRQRPLATDHAALGAVTFEGNNDANEPVTFAEDFAVARTIAEGTETGERWFEVCMDGKSEPGMIIAKPNIDSETSIFLSIKAGSKTVMRRVMLEDHGDGTASLKIKLRD